MMEKKKLIGWIAAIPALVLLLIIIILVSEPSRDGISRAQAYKAAALSMTSAGECERQEREGTSRFPEGEQNKWYVKYMDYLYGKGILTEESAPPKAETAEGFLTYREAADLAKAISPDLDGALKVSGMNQKKPIPQKRFWRLYDRILGIQDPEHGAVVEKEILLYGTPANVEEAPEWTAYTSEGRMRFEGLGLDAYIDQEIRVLVRDEEMLRVAGTVSESVIYRNVWMVEGEEGALGVCVGGIRRRFPYHESMGNLGQLVNNLADVHLDKGKLKKIVVKKNRIAGKVLAVKDDAIEIEGYGPVKLDEDFKVYKIYGEFKQQRMSDILVGYDIQEFVVEGDRLCAALMERAFDAKSIRVLIMDTGFHSKFHQSVTVSCDGDMILVHGEIQETVPAGRDLAIGLDDGRLDDGRIVLKPVDPNGVIRVSSVERAQGVPAYGGHLEINKEPEGLVLVNELYLEDYLTKVVPSEMPASYEKEALKAQAVCARTYAYKRIQENYYSQYGAHVDDSTRYQVYNNVNSDPRTAAAVNETYGKMLTLGDQVVEAYYFSTSCGHTTDGTIWGADASAVPYLQGVALRDSREPLDLTTNEEFTAFIKDWKFPTYESAFPLYRWETTVNNLELERKIKGVGTILNLTMTERGMGGIGKTLRVEGSEGTKNIEGQGQIRSLLGNPELTFTKKDGGTLTGQDALPSAFIAIEVDGINENNVTTFHIYGGGYGHGVGMSQNGAQAMAKAGKGYEEILRFFFEGVEVKEVDGGQG